MGNCTSKSTGRGEAGAAKPTTKLVANAAGKTVSLADKTVTPVAGTAVPVAPAENTIACYKARLEEWQAEVARFRYEGEAQPLRAVDPQSMEYVIDAQPMWPNIGGDANWTSRIVFLQKSDRAQFELRIVPVHAMVPCKAVADAVAVSSTWLLVVTGDSGSGKTLTTVYEAARLHTTDTPVVVFYTTCCDEKQFSNIQPSADLVKLFGAPELTAKHAMRSACVQTYIEGRLLGALASKGSTLRKFANSRTRVFVVLDEAGACNAFTRAPCRHHHVMETRLGWLMGLADNQVRIVVVGTGANPVSCTPGSIAGSYKLVVMNASTGDAIVNKYRGCVDGLGADLLAAVVPEESALASQWGTLGRSLSGNARIAALFINVIGTIHDWVHGQDSLWTRNGGEWSSLDASDMAPMVVRLGSAAFAVLNGLRQLNAEQRMRALASAAAVAFSGTDDHLPEDQYMALAVRYGLLTDTAVLMSASSVTTGRKIEIGETDDVAVVPKGEARYLFSAASAALFATGFGHAPHQRDLEGGGYYLEHALRDALQLQVAAAFQWRCDANVAAASGKPARVLLPTNPTQQLFSQLHDVLQQLPDTEPTREIITLQASHAFEPQKRVASETTTVTAADAYLRALHQVADNDPVFFSAFGGEALPEAATGFTEKQREALLAHGPIIVLLNRPNAMGPDMLVLSYGYGALAASCKADDAGKGGHAEVLCKLGLATVPFAYGDTFPVVRYALVHGAVEAKAIEWKAIEASLESALGTARDFRDKIEAKSLREIAVFTSKLPCKNGLLYSAIQEFTKKPKNEREGKQGAASNNADVESKEEVVLSDETLEFHQKGLDEFLNRSTMPLAERFADIQYILATHGTAALGSMPLPAAVSVKPQATHRFKLQSCVAK